MTYMTPIFIHGSF